ncbi:YsnF/AvaK domain-containing protein [Kushneria sp. Sum13]|uniref:YsnF/AvaK domain-containing protein n=1 Tax=Kushneria sp. Sum13 TaxID=3459196 RepID=UPI00404596BB
MDEQLVVAVYDTEARANAAMHDLREAGIPEEAINRHAHEGREETSAHEQHDKPSFWQRLFGKSDEDTSDYDRNVEQGATVIAVRTSIEDLERIEDILERHDPVDIDEQNIKHAGSPGAGVAPSVASGSMASGVAHAKPADHDTHNAHDGHTDREERLALSEEELKVGKRDVDRGTTRVRRHVVNERVEEDVALRDESVSVERRPVTGDRPVSDADFTDKTVEMTETDEEAVVSKEAHVREEVAVRKDVGEHTDHISENVRHHEVDIDKTDDTRRDDKLDPKNR